SDDRHGANSSRFSLKLPTCQGVKTDQRKGFSMTNRAFLKTGIWAMGGFFMTLAIMAPPRLDATSPTTAPVVKGDKSKLVVDGVELSLRYGEQESPLKMIKLEPDKPFAFEMIATNTTDDSVSIKPKISVTSASLESMFSRTPRRDKEAWSTEQELSLS